MVRWSFIIVVIGIFMLLSDLGIIPMLSPIIWAPLILLIGIGTLVRISLKEKNREKEMLMEKILELEKTVKELKKDRK